MDVRETFEKPEEKVPLKEIQEAVDEAIVGPHWTEQIKDPLRRRLYRAWEREAGGNLCTIQKLIGGWRRRKHFKTDWDNAPEKLMLVVTELSEAMEAWRHITPETRRVVVQDAAADLPDDQRPWVDNFAEEIADAFIRIVDLCDALEIDLVQETYWKMADNEMRPLKHGKEC